MFDEDASTHEGDVAGWRVSIVDGDLPWRRPAGRGGTTNYPAPSPRGSTRRFVRRPAAVCNDCNL